MSEKQYYDLEGEPVTLDKLCRTDSAWAASRIRAITSQRDQLTEETAEYQRENAALREAKKLDAVELGRLRKRCIRVYNSGYKAGHHDTVEGWYTDIHSCDMDTYHDEDVAELLNELSAQSNDTPDAEQDARPPNEPPKRDSLNLCVSHQIIFGQQDRPVGCLPCFYFCKGYRAGESDMKLVLSEQDTPDAEGCAHTERVWDTNPAHDEECLQCGASLQNPVAKQDTPD